MVESSLVESSLFVATFVFLWLSLVTESPLSILILVPVEGRSEVKRCVAIVDVGVVVAA